jgi:cytoskeletal protein RodZ
MITAKDLGIIFKEAREAKNMTVDQVTTKSKIHPNVVRDIENGVLDRLDALYVKSFVKKYAEFLGLDGEDIVGKYQSIKMGIPQGAPNFDKAVEKDKAKKSRVDRQAIAEMVKEGAASESGQSPMKDDIVMQQIRRAREKYVKKINYADEARGNINKIAVLAGTALATALIAAVAVVGIRAGAGFIKNAAEKRAEAQQERSAQEAIMPTEKKVKGSAKKQPASLPKKESKAILDSLKDDIKQSPPTNTASKQQSTAALKLVLSAKGDVWVQVFSGGKTVFAETMSPGSSKALDSDGTLTVWTGKGENLEFSVNGRDLGVVVEGVVRNIVVSKDGVKLGDKWLERL